MKYNGNEFKTAESGLIYNLRQDGWCCGDPVMVNDVAITIEARHLTAEQQKEISDEILSLMNSRFGPESDFNIGDLIRIVADDGMDEFYWAGDTGIIGAIGIDPTDDGNPSYRVDFNNQGNPNVDNDGIWWVAEEHMAKAL